MKTDNELIEEFWVSQGGKPNMGADLWFYESDWNMLMPVVEKIGKLDENFLIANDQPETPVRLMMTTPIFEPIQVVHYRVVKFIKWYNENKK